MSTLPKIASNEITSLSEILSGGEEPLTRIELPMIIKGGLPAIVYAKRPSLEDVAQYTDAQAAVKRQKTRASKSKSAAPWDSRKDNVPLIELMRPIIVNADGKPVFAGSSVDELLRMPAAVFQVLAEAVTRITFNTDDDKDGSGTEDGGDDSDDDAEDD